MANDLFVDVSEWHKVEVNPDEAYPEAIETIQTLLKNGNEPGLGSLRNLLARARAAGIGAFDLALKRREECDPEDLGLRAEALQVVRLWVTEELHFDIGYERMHLHILKGSGRWRP